MAVTRVLAVLALTIAAALALPGESPVSPPLLPAIYRCLRCVGCQYHPLARSQAVNINSCADNFALGVVGASGC